MQCITFKACFSSDCQRFSGGEAFFCFCFSGLVYRLYLIILSISVSGHCILCVPSILTNGDIC